MYILVALLVIIGSGSIVTLLFGLMRAGGRADDGEDSITRMLTEQHHAV